jgi:hypothetical protein
MLLLSPVEFFGQVQAPIGKKLSLLFHLTGFPYISGSLKRLSESLKLMAAGGGLHPATSSDAKRALDDWTEANGKQARDLVTAAVLETVRKNVVLRKLATSDQPVTNIHVAREVPEYEALDWAPMQELVALSNPFSHGRNRKRQSTALRSTSRPSSVIWDLRPVN